MYCIQLLLGRSDADCYDLKQLYPGLAPSDVISRRDREIPYKDKAIQAYGLLDKQSKACVSFKVQVLSWIKK